MAVKGKKRISKKSSAKAAGKKTLRYSPNTKKKIPIKRETGQRIVRIKRREKPRRSRKVLRERRRKPIVITQVIRDEKAPLDMEELFIIDLIKRENRYPEAGLMLPTVLYNSTSTMKEFAYRYGFTIGKEIFRKSGSAGVDALMDVLSHAGMGRMMYTPAADSIMIRGAASETQRINFGQNMHSLESGIMAGYLSAFGNQPVQMVETQCAYNGASACRFTSSPVTEVEPARQSDIEDVLKAMVEGMLENDNDNEEKAQGYMLLSLLPIVSEPLLAEASKLMFLAGRRLADSSKGMSNRYVIRKMGSFFYIGDVSIGELADSFTIRLTYDSYNSISGFVDLSTKAFIGFLNKRFNSAVRLSKERRDGGYVVTLTAAKVR